jgi:hypothetical protein
MEDEIDLSNSICLFDGNRGQYIPKHFAEDIDRNSLHGVKETWLDDLALGPEYDHYWETWSIVLDHATISHPKLGECFLHHDGDLWLVAIGERNENV